MSTTLRASGLSWSTNGRPILHDVDLLCPPGSVTGLLGPNGSGKTTLLHLLSGQRRPTTGTVLLGDDLVHQLRPLPRARRIALVEQHAETGLDLRVRDVVALGRHPHHERWTFGRDEDEMVGTAMNLAQITDLAERTWSTLSGGERQRTHLARAIAQDPEVLLLDEPTNHLDLRHQIDFLHRVRALAVTTVAALHDLELAAAFCDRVLVLADGRVRAAGPTAEVLTADLVREVWGVEAGVSPHPARKRPHIWWAEPS